MQILEAEVNVVLALNMSDIAASRGIDIDVDHLSEALGVPVASMVARKGQGLDDLKQIIAKATKSIKNGNDFKR